MDNDDHLRRLEAAVWVTIGLIAAGMVGSALTGRFELDWRSFLVPLAVRRLRWVALALNAAMLIATPAYGSHYLVDVFAGVAIAAVCRIIAARKLLAKARPIAAIGASLSIVPEMEQRQVASAREQESAAHVAQA